VGEREKNKENLRKDGRTLRFVQKSP